MRNMFLKCSNLLFLDLSNFKKSNENARKVFEMGIASIS